MKILAVDLGDKRTGLAVSDPDEKLAVALPTLRDADAEAVAAVAKEQGAGLVVVGLPLNMDGTAGPRAQATQEFAQELQELLPVPVATWDERLSTEEAHSRMRGQGLSRKERSKRKDAAAAIVILESFLSSRRQRRAEDAEKTQTAESQSRREPTSNELKTPLHELSAAELDQLDRAILNREILRGIEHLRAVLGVGLKEALGLFSSRYAELRKARPNEFSCSEDDYWKGFYS